MNISCQVLAERAKSLGFDYTNLKTLRIEQRCNDVGCCTGLKPKTKKGTSTIEKEKFCVYIAGNKRREKVPTF